MTDGRTDPTPRQAPSGRRALAVLLTATLTGAVAAGGCVASLAAGFDRRPRGIERISSRRAEVTLRASDDGDAETWEGLIQAAHLDSGAGVAYAIKVRWIDREPPETVYARPIDFVGPLETRCAPAPSPAPVGAIGVNRVGRVGRGDKAFEAGVEPGEMAYYRCALSRCFARARRCAGRPPEATACLAERCRDALISCVLDTLGCGD